jgi:hypothetical protein
MTTVEMNNEFDIHYNSIAGQSAPGIDSYEKSVYLTKAQLEIVKNYYDSLSNRKQKGFENTEKRRVDLKELIKDYKSQSSINNASKIHPSARFFNIPNDTFLIINERVKIISPDDLCDNGRVIDVKAITYDEFNTQIKNPFKTPDTKTSWRLDVSRVNNSKTVEIVSPYNISASLEYQMRYIKYPSPIILEDLAAAYPGENLSIDGITALKACELDTEIHREILDRAVELALLDYKQANLQAKVQLDARNE